MLTLQPATRPTIYFIGVTTGSSSIMRVFPKWAEALGLDAIITGIDLVPHSSVAEYREAVEFIKNDPLSMGALVTTHKIDLYNACKDLFEFLDPYAVQLGEISCISKQGAKLCGHAKDPISSGLALQRFVPKNFWSERNGEVLLLGAGGASLAMALYFCKNAGEDIPRKITIANRSKARLDSARQILSGLNDRIEVEFVLNPTAEDNDKTLSEMSDYSLIVNGTGLGKDAPGSPITDAASFPTGSLVWEINYRGDLLIMAQAKAQQAERKLVVEDGWVYFIHGWTQVVAEVFHIDDIAGRVDELSIIARNA
ncbi:MAG: shikimate dehydrogenase [Firmicutes bacterium HGW-Firmicutes-16]|nr:MAG: shikimate dehydrogenase [Firmicutes bacterium HGW-Firmicutes-16]